MQNEQMKIVMIFFIRIKSKVLCISTLSLFLNEK